MLVAPARFFAAWRILNMPAREAPLLEVGPLALLPNFDAVLSSSWPLRESISEPIGTVATPLIGTNPLIGAFCAARA